MSECEAIYKEMYLTLFRSVTTALEIMEQQNYGTAKKILQAAQQKAEDLYIEQAE